MSNPESIRDLLEQALGTRLREELWQFLNETGYVQKVLAGEMEFQRFERVVDYLLYPFGQPKRRQGPEDLTQPMLPPHDLDQAAREYPLRQVVLSHLLAADAARDLSLQSFRYNVLKGKLLAWNEIDAWIRNHYQIDSESHAPLPWETMISFPKEEITRILPAWVRNELEVYGELAKEAPVLVTLQPEFMTKPLVQMKHLVYYLPGEKWQRIMPTPPRGKLAELRHICGFLALKYGWAEGQATTFALTGLTPLLSAISHDFEGRNPLGASRIVLSIDPATSPDEVAEHYRRFRKKLIPSRQREITEKHLLLAFFIRTTGREDETWGEAMVRWNQQFPQWTYQQETNFARDANLVIRRLLDPEIRSQQWWEELDNGEESER